MRPTIKQVIDRSSGKGIRLQGMSIQDGELREIIDYIIETHSNIEQLGFPNNKLTDVGAAILAENLAFLVQNHQLNYLNLESNDIDKKGFTDLCNELNAINPNFYIAFRGNKFRDPDVADDIQKTAITRKKPL